MSQKLYEFAEQFLLGKLHAEKFASEYMTMWKQERDSGDLLKDDPKVSGKLSTFFCLADLYNSEDDRESYELDEVSLRKKIQEVYDADTADDLFGDAKQ